MRKRDSREHLLVAQLERPASFSAATVLQSRFDLRQVFQSVQVRRVREAIRRVCGPRRTSTHNDGVFQLRRVRKAFANRCRISALAISEPLKV